MTDAALAILGTLGGTIVGVLGTLAVERSRREHADATRWHDRRLASYAAVTESVLTLKDAITAARIRLQREKDASRAEVLGLLKVFRARTSEADLLGGRPVRLAIVEMRSAVNDVADRLLKAPHGMTVDDFDPIDERHGDFRDAARAELGIGD